MSQVTDLGALPLFVGSDTDLYTTKSEPSEFLFLLAEYNILRKIANELRYEPTKQETLRQYINNQKIHVDVRKVIGPILPEGHKTSRVYDTPKEGRGFRKQSKNLQFYFSSANTEKAKVRPESIPSILLRADAQGLQNIRASDWSQLHVGDNFYLTAEKRDQFYASATLNACHIVGTDIWKILKDELNKEDPKKLELFSKKGKKEFVAEGTAICFLGRQELHNRLSKNEQIAKSLLKNDNLLKINPNQALKKAMDRVYTDDSMAPLKRFAYEIIDKVLG